MLTLYHFWLCPFSRKARIVLKEKGLEFEATIERYWERRLDFLALNPAGQVPVLHDDEGLTLADSQAICEYLDEVCPTPPLLGPTARRTNSVCGGNARSFSTVVPVTSVPLPEMM